MILPPAPKPIIFEFTQELKEWQEELAQGTFRQPGNTQTLEQKRENAMSGVFLEHALVLQGAIKNPAKFDKTDRYSYCWDVDWHNLLSEVKRCHIEDATKWFTFPQRQVETMCKNLDIVQLLIVGDYKIIEDNMISVDWLLMSNPQNFRTNMKPCKIQKYDEIKYFYNHHASETIMLKDCVNV